MGYYVRVFSTSSECVPFDELKSALVDNSLKAEIQCEEEDESGWNQLLLIHKDGREIAVIERNPVFDRSLGEEEIEEFLEDIEDGKPASAAKWLKEYFKKIKCIYAFQVLSGTDHKNGWEILGAVKEAVWNYGPGILQADSEGFSNEEGYHILWQFSDSVDGNWWMAVLDGKSWKNFEMDLGNKDQRAAFLEGKVPIGVNMA